MLKKIIGILSVIFHLLFAQAQTSNYYYQGQSKAIALSERVMIVKFIAGTGNSVKQQIISNAQVDLLNGSMANIPDIYN